MSIEQSPLLALNTGALLFGLFAAILCGYLCAILFRNNYNFKKSALLYAALSVVMTAVLLLMKLYWLFCAGYVLMGFICLLLFSNHYFYKQ